jgi:hypothetical protein
MVIREPRTLLTNSSEKTLPFYTEKAEREETNEFQKCINPTHLALYGQVQELRRTFII